MNKDGVIDNISIKKLPFDKQGRFITVRISEDGYKLIYENECKLTNKAKLQQIIEDLKAKGVSFKVDENKRNDIDWFS